MLVFLAVLGAGFVVVMALGRFTRHGESSGLEEDDDGGHSATHDASGGKESVSDDGALARRWRRGEVPVVRGLVEPAQNLPPVLLPDDPASDDVDRLRFSAGLRGYRMDQVDEVLDILRDSLAAKEQRLAELEVEVAELGAGPGDTDAGGDWANTGPKDADTDQSWRGGETRDPDTEQRWPNGSAP
ncbi:MAG TPA: DivIVA domain-containing protein [Arthrobacter sp.]|nr:DivIVA domain-containing protein [Arthrobacter sp.]